MPNGEVNANQIRLGSSYPVQVITITGTPTGGTNQARFKNGLSTSWTYNDTADNVRDAIRALKVDGVAPFPAATVIRSGSNPNFVYTVTLNYAHGSVTQLMDVLSGMTGGTSPAATVTATEIPLEWPLVAGTQITERSVDAVAGKQFIANSEGVGQERTSQIKISEWVMEDWTAGLGHYDYRESETAFGFWDSNAMTWVRGQLTCGPQSETMTGAAAYSISDKIRFNGVDYFISAYDATLSGANLGHVFKVSSSDVVTTVRASTGQAASGTDCYLHVYKDYMYCFPGDNANQFYYMNTSEVFAASASTPWTGAAPVIAVNWDTGMFAIQTNKNGAVLYRSNTNPTTAVGDWTALAQIPDGSKVKGMKVWLGPDKNAAIYILTETGLWWYDAISTRILIVVQGNFGSYTNIGTFNTAHNLEVFQSNLYIVGNTTIFKWDGTTLKNIGPNTNFGLPTSSYKFNQAGPIVPFNIAALNHWIIARVVSTITNKIDVLIYDGQAWHPIAVPNDLDTTSASWYTYSLDGAREGIYYASFSSGQMHRFAFNDAAPTPLFWSGMRYRTSATHITGWFDRGLSEVPKTGYVVRVRARGLSATEYIKIYYQIDYAADSTSTNIGTDPRNQWVQMVDAAGSALTINAAAVGGSGGVVFAYFDRQTLADGATYYSKGLRHYDIRFRFELTGAGGTVTPILHAATFGLDPLFEPLWAYGASLDLSQQAPDGRDPEVMRADLREILQSFTLTNFSFEDSAVKQVRVDQLGLSVGTGYNLNSGPVPPTAQLQLSERISTR